MSSRSFRRVNACTVATCLLFSTTGTIKNLNADTILLDANPLTVWSQSTTQTIPTGVTTALTWDINSNQQGGTAGLIELSSINSQVFTLPYEGVYNISLVSTWSATGSTAGYRRTWAVVHSLIIPDTTYVNNQYPFNSIVDLTYTSSEDFYAHAGDTVTVFAEQTNGTSIAFGPGRVTIDLRYRTVQTVL